jgi:2-methylcitrate dehydratase PrpD
LLDVKGREGFRADEVEAIEIGVDPIVPTILLYDRPSSGLEGKFSMPFCAAAAIVNGRVGIDTFELSQLRDPAILAMQARVTMRVDSTLDHAAPSLTQANVTVRLRDGRVLTASANGARGYPEKPASDDELAAKFMSCATQTVSASTAASALAVLRDLESVGDVRTFTELLHVRSR